MEEDTSRLPLVPEITKRGSLRMIISMMYGGKSSYLIHLMETLGHACRVLYINHTFDTRGDGKPYSTHSITLDKNLSDRLNATMIQVPKLGDVPYHVLREYSVVCIDEGQFFPDLYEKVRWMVDDLDLDVYLAGLNGDTQRQKFGHLAELFPDIDQITVLRDTLCSTCASHGRRTPALFTWRLKESGEQIEIGAANYIPVCRGCYNYLRKERNWEHTVDD